MFWCVIVLDFNFYVAKVKMHDKTHKRMQRIHIIY